jgi:WD40 repeat protein
MLLAASRSPARAAQPRTDALGDPLPPFALARLGTQRLWHGSQPTAIAFSPDDKIVASASGDICLWDVATGKELRRFNTKHDMVRSLDFAADGQTLIGAGIFSDAVYLFDVAEGKEKICLGTPPRLGAVASGDDWAWVRPVALSADGKTLAVPATAPQQCIRWHDAGTGKVLGETKLEGTYWPLFIAVTADGKTFACRGEEENIIVVDRTSGKVLHRLPGHQERPLCGAFSGDGKLLATGGMDRRVRLWDVTTGKEVRELRKHERSVLSVCFLPDGTTLLSTSSDRICLWESSSGKLLREFGPPGIKAAAVSHHGKLLAVLGDNGTIVLWDLVIGQQIHPVNGHRKGVNALAYSPDGKTLVSGGDDAVLVWDAAKRAVLRHLGPPVTTAERLAFLPDGKTLVVGTTWNPPELWDPFAGKLLRSFQGPKQAGGMRLSPDGKLLATLAWKPYDSKDQIPLAYLWDVAKGEACGTVAPNNMPGPNRDTHCVVFSPDGKLLATGGTNLPIRLWSVPEGKLVREFGESAYGLAFAPNGELLAAERSGVVTFHETATGKVAGTFGKSAGFGIGMEWPLLFSPDGRTVATGDMRGLIRLCEVATSQERRRFQGHKGYVQALAFAPDGKTLVSAGEDTTIVVWDLTASATVMTVAEAWLALAGGDAGRAYDGICTLAAGKDTVAFLKARLPLLRPVEAKQVQQLLADLGSDTFAVRARAMHELELLQELAVPALEKSLEQQPLLEVRLRVEQLLAKVAPGKLTANSERLRWLRALEALERLGTPQARELLRALADGDDSVRLVREAKVALRRLEGSK